MGKVYKGVHPSIKSRVAIKVLSAACAADPHQVQRFFAEARAVNLIKHDNIVEVMDLAVLDNGRPYILMEYLEGQSLHQALAQRVRFQPEVIAEVIIEVLAGLSAAHSRHIVHRDIKPENIFLTKSGRIKLLDFGIAKLQPDIAKLDSATKTGTLLGTPHYMAPEQAVCMPVDARSDLYAVGLVLYEGVTGVRPFDAPSLFELLKQHVERTPQTPSSLVPGLPEAYDEVILRAVKKDPADRFQSAEEFIQALAEAMEVSPRTTTASAPIAISELATAETLPSSKPFPAVSPVEGATGGSSPVVPAESPNLAKEEVSGRTKRPFVVVGLALAVVIGIGASFLAGRSTSQTGLIEPTTPAKRSSVPIATTSSEARSLAVSRPCVNSPALQQAAAKYDRGRFDPSAFLLEAHALVKDVYEDAALVSFNASGVSSVGRLNLDAKDRLESHTAYLFYSPAKQKCISVMVSGLGVLCTISASRNCGSLPLPLPKCTLAQVIAKASKGWTMRHKPLARLSYLTGAGPVPRWAVIRGQVKETDVPDDCKPSD